MPGSREWNSLGRYNTDEDVDFVLARLPAIVENLRAMAR